MEHFQLSEWPEYWPDLQQRARRLRMTVYASVEPDGSMIFSVMRWGWWREFKTAERLTRFLDQVERGRP